MLAENSGLRQRKTAQTRAAIAACAARLFGDADFGTVTMIKIAQAAGVSEQTVYNYFPTKESLVFDRIDEVLRTLLDLVAERDPETGVVDAYARWLQAGVLGRSARRARRHAGGMPRLVAANPGLRRHLLDHADRMSAALAAKLAGAGQFDPLVARTLTDALLQVFVRAVDRLGTVRTDAQIATLEADVHRALDVLRPAFTGDTVG